MYVIKYRVQKATKFIVMIVDFRASQTPVIPLYMHVVNKAIKPLKTTTDHLYSCVCNALHVNATNQPNTLHCTHCSLIYLGTQCIHTTHHPANI